MQQNVQSTTIEFSDSFKKAFDLMENTNSSVFITGKAGTGKSTLLDYFRTHTKKNVVVLAPTGVAAVNVKGQTIHSFFKLWPNITLDRIYRKYDRSDPENLYAQIDTIVIDEISMVRADLLDIIDKFMRLNGPKYNYPFGGVQMIFIGDLFQLPPVVTDQEMSILADAYNGPYFFDSHTFSQFNMEVIELDHVYRQRDEQFIDILNAIRNDSISQEDLDTLNSQYDPYFEPANDEFFMYLTTTNYLANTINVAKLSQLSTSAHQFDASIDGKFEHGYYPTDPQLSLKVGAQIMMLNNDVEKRWHNGSIGKVVDFLEPTNEKHKQERAIMVELADGNIYKIEPHTWDCYAYSVDAETGKVKTESVGSFTQYPLKLAWAVTIHKSQGKTFDKVIIDIGSGTFAHGQMYVALSRCTSLGGIILKKKIEKRHIIVDERIIEFCS